MRTAPQKNGWQLGPSLAAGLTLRFYPAFEICTATLPAYKERVAREMPEYDRFAIHTLVSQTADGALTLGDSHEYGLAVDVFNKAEIDELVMRDLRKFLVAPTSRSPSDGTGCMRNTLTDPTLQSTRQTASVSSRLSAAPA